MFPTDLIRPIISYLDNRQYGDQPTLHSCCLVDKRFAAECQPLLFSGIGISEYKQDATTRLLTLLQSPSSAHLASWIRFFQIDFKDAYRLAGEAEADILALLPSVTALQISFSSGGIRWDGGVSPRFVEVLRENIIPGLEKLNIDYCKGFPVQVLARGTALQSVRFRKVQISGWPFLNVTPKIALNHMELDHETLHNAVDQTSGFYQLLREGTDQGQLRSLKFWAFGRYSNFYINDCKMLLGQYRRNLTKLDWGADTLRFWDQQQKLDILLLSSFPSLEHLIIHFSPDTPEPFLSWIAGHLLDLGPTYHPLKTLTWDIFMWWKPNSSAVGWKMLDQFVELEGLMEFELMTFRFVDLVTESVLDGYKEVLPGCRMKGVLNFMIDY
ncbi:hypothetical protein DL96DRAFT_1581075 [Flagelloscypha sp. PMI_526]|nr:hypothetical protein DL96DRAFT_1581075 [Flagelloscypha sp. PMI_526]